MDIYYTYDYLSIFTVQVSSLTAKLQDMKKHNEELKRAIGALYTKIEGLEKENNELKMEIAQLNTNAHQFKVSNVYLYIQRIQ